MRLFELINTQTVTRNLSKPFDVDKMNVDRDKAMMGLSSGVYSRGTVDKKDPHIFKKVSHLPSDLDNDGYYAYVQAIKPYIANNPYFPRVYVVQLDTDPDGKVVPKYDIETLLDAEEFSLESLVAIAKRMFTLFRPSHNPNNMDDMDDMFEKNDVRRRIAKYISDCAETGDYSALADNNLKNAITLIRRVEDSNDRFSMDIHRGNIMFRGTKHGPQVVITDPIA